jgi:hypothetical protein
MEWIKKWAEKSESLFAIAEIGVNFPTEYLILMDGELGFLGDYDVRYFRSYDEAEKYRVKVLDEPEEFEVVQISISHSMGILKREWSE